MTTTATSYVLYRLYDASGLLLYVGVTKNLVARLKQHRAAQPWWNEVAATKLITLPDRKASEAAEKVAIRAEEPIYNSAHTDIHRIRCDSSIPRETRIQLVEELVRSVRERAVARREGRPVPVGVGWEELVRRVAPQRRRFDRFFGRDCGDWHASA